MNIGFWNLNKKNLSDLLVELVSSRDLDILVLAECKIGTTLDFLRKIKAVVKNHQYKLVPCSKDRLTIITRYDLNVFTDKSHLYKSTRFVAFTVRIPSIVEFNLMGIHFHSKVHWSDISLAMECATAARDISLVETETDNYQTIVIGDFNMSPFESGMVAANGFHALYDLNQLEAAPQGRTIDATHYPYFYNPMWNFLGDHNPPFGTIFYKQSGNVSYDWHIFDQVLFRPSVRKFLAKKYVEVISRINTYSLVNAMQRPDKDQYSDHLPILFSLNI